MKQDNEELQNSKGTEEKKAVMLDRIRFEFYWSYYLSIEKMLRNTSQYVSPSRENKDTYSDEFAKIILLSCSEIDSILKSICKCKGIHLADKKYNMAVYAKVLVDFEEIKEIAYCPSANTSIKEKGLAVYPFKDLDKDKKWGNLNWWESYQLLKHNRIDNAERANLHNAVFSTSAYYMLLRLLIDFLDENSETKDYINKHSVSEYLLDVI